MSARCPACGMTDIHCYQCPCDRSQMPLDTPLDELSELAARLRTVKGKFSASHRGFLNYAADIVVRAWAALDQREKQLIDTQGKLIDCNAKLAESEKKPNADTARLDFLAEITNLGALRDCGAMLTGEQERLIRRTVRAMSTRYERHRRGSDTPTAFRLAVDEAMKGAGRG